jgi:glutamate synthase (NADPH/NADH) small chain
MSSSMLKFVSKDQKGPAKRSANGRREDFDEIYQEFTSEEAAEQASRCSQCGVPYCQVHCPLSNNIPDWLMLAANGRLEEAYQLSSATNNFPEICGRICPQDRLCEGNCVIEQAGHGTVTIGSIEKYITETAWEKGWVQPVRPAYELNQSVGIIGAGPGGLAAAEELRKSGYQVTVYDRYDRVGGLMIYGIPSFKLDKSVVGRRAKLLEESGITFKLKCEIGKDINLDELRENHDAVLIATGVYKARDIKAPGVGLENVVPALSFLTANNKNSLGDEVNEFQSGKLDAKDKSVVVIGGGDTAMDCVRTAIRQGAKSVKCLYRRDQENMPGSQREVANAIEEGVEFVWQTAPEAFLGDKKITAVQAVKMRLGAPDESGRQRPKIVKDSSHKIEADLVIKALGFDPEDLPTTMDAAGLTVSDWGTIRVSWTSMMTSMPGVFAAGDIVRGASLVVWAIKDGQDAAAQINLFLKEKLLTEQTGVAAE